MNVKSHDAAVRMLLETARGREVETIWDRHDSQEPRCGFGETGLCCRHCAQGPCRINPFGEEPRYGACGADAATMVARGLVRAIAAGCAAHSGHAKHLAHALHKWTRGETEYYPVKDEAKLKAVAAAMGISGGGGETRELAHQLVKLALEQFAEGEEPLPWAFNFLTAGRKEVLEKLGAVPTGIENTIAEMMHRTHMGVDADPVNLLLGGVACAVADFAGSHMATDLADILFGTPRPVVSRANLGVMDAAKVNIALHGHNPVLSDLLVRVARGMEGEAAAAGAAGINMMGVCCTGNEILMRHGVPAVTHSISQELPILTGALDAMVVDYQCVYPSLVTVASCAHTRVITTMGMAKISGATHIEFTEENAMEAARAIIREAIEAFKARKGLATFIPQVESTVVAGFSVEAILAALAKLDQADPLKPLIDNIISGNIQGVVLVAGCNNVKVPQDENFLGLAKELLARDVLLLATGCGAGAYARHGLLSPGATGKYAGPGLKAVLTAIGEANGLGGPLPPVLHIGSCVDNSRAVDIAVAVANKLGVDLDRLPVAASAPEYKTEKAVSIGTYAVACGLPVHLGIVPPVLGSPLVTQLLTAGVKDLLGGYFIVETDPVKAAQAIFAALQQRRQGLGLATRDW
ncbi:MAG: anaerobic carbon-monoxide dehydrogenase catalytic subunit [Peptococcaceae bacterium]|nr:anaerobic carbon-monoxide dehydrogenase catalytic subunit [Peptococcaceae bacterium]